MCRVISGLYVSVLGLSVINCVSVRLLGYVVLLISGLLMLDHPVRPGVTCNDVASKWRIVCRLQ